MQTGPHDPIIDLWFENFRRVVGDERAYNFMIEPRDNGYRIIRSNANGERSAFYTRAKLTAMIARLMAWK